MVLFTSMVLEYISVNNICGKGKGKVIPTGHVGPEGSRRVKAPSFRDNGTVIIYVVNYKNRKKS